MLSYFFSRNLHFVLWKTDLFLTNERGITMINFWIIFGAIVAANITSVALATLVMSNGGILKWLYKRYEKIADFWMEEL